MRSRRLECVLVFKGVMWRQVRYKAGGTVLCSSWKGLELLAAQTKTQDASCLPALRVSDIEPTIPVTPVQISTAGTTKSVPSSYHIYTANAFFLSSSSVWNIPPHRRRSRAVLWAAHQRAGLLQSHVQSQHAARGAQALRPALLQRHHQVSKPVGSQQALLHEWGLDFI